MSKRGLLTKRNAVIAGVILFFLLFVAGIVAKGARYEAAATVILSILVIIITGLFIFLGLFVIIGKAIDAIRGIKSESWPTVKGTITSSMYSEEDVPGGYDSVGYTEYHSDIDYDYSVGGIFYMSHRVSFGSWGTKGDAKKAVSKYTYGMPVTIYYNPKNPCLSTLEPGFQPGIFFGLLFGLILLASSVGIFIVFLNYL